ncbi:DnaA/Hda family protein [Gammaproteobacteria bacterium]|nr:DnaA/Hda family protein [Gammaproteobacteria bacterium]
MNQKVLDIFLPKERSLDQLKNFSFLKKMISETELFFSNEENFLLLNIKEDLIRNYLFQASFNSYKIQPKIIDLNEKIFNPDVFKYPMVFIKNLSSDTLNQESEIFLFNGFNYCLNQNTKILFSSNDFIKNLDIKLEDLESRLNTVLPVEILNPADEEKMNLINFELQQRGLEINDKEMQYIFTHHSRDLNSLLNLAEKLDEISHQEKKSISINLIKKII